MIQMTTGVVYKRRSISGPCPRHILFRGIISSNSAITCTTFNVVFCEMSAIDAQWTLIGITATVDVFVPTLNVGQADWTSRCQGPYA